jgi:thioesterase domain-containing protein/acyl carrier protein
LTHHLVNEAVVIDREKQDGEKYLCAYILQKKSFDLAELKDYLPGHLPEYMIPSYFIPIERIPLNPNGKLDRRALPIPGVEAGEEYAAPANEIEERFAVIWSEVLAIERERISMDADFFSLGGHSLNATVIVSKINREFKVNVPLIQIFTTPTIRQLAAYLSGLEGEGAAPEDNRLVRLKKGLSHNHLFLVHDGSGEVEAYIELCSRLAVDINCWGIRAQGFAGYAPHNLRIEEIAETYIRKVKKVQPNGPYCIMGWSLGGTIAFEMVRQLEGAGETVIFFALVDVLPPGKNLPSQVVEFTVPSEKEWLSEFLGNRGIVVPGAETGSLETLWLSVVKALERQGADIENIREQIPGYVRRVIPNFDRLTLRELIYHYNVTRTFIRARDQYMPEGSVKTPIHFFAAGRANIEKEIGWQEYSHSPLKMIEINGDHFSVMKPPGVEALAKHFESLIGLE